MNLAKDVGPGVRKARADFDREVDAIRPELHRYCLHLTGSVWDAEDLVQDTLLRAFSKLGEVFQTIEHPRAYLLRIATNLWFDRCRSSGERSMLIADETMPADSAPIDACEIREAAEQLIACLPPRERVAIVLKDVLGLSLEECAELIGTTVGAVKASLYRGRSALVESRKKAFAPNAARYSPSHAVVDAFVRVFNARDLKGITALLLDQAQAEVIGMVQEFGKNSIEKGSVAHTLAEEGAPRAAVAVFRGEQVVLLWYTDTQDGKKRETVQDVLRFETCGDRISRMRYYYFCPETLRAVAKELGVPVDPIGYRFPAPNKS